MSETIVGTLTPVSQFVKGSCGILIPNTLAKVVDVVTRESLGPGKTGELCLKGPQVALNFFLAHY